jgi:hypothetical protein
MPQRRLLTTIGCRAPTCPPRRPRGVVAAERLSRYTPQRQAGEQHEESHDGTLHADAAVVAGRRGPAAGDEVGFAMRPRAAPGPGCRVGCPVLM